MDFFSLVSHAKAAGINVESFLNIVALYVLVTRPLKALSKEAKEYRKETDYKFKQIEVHTGVKLKAREI